MEVRLALSCRSRPQQAARASMAAWVWASALTPGAAWRGSGEGKVGAQAQQRRVGLAEQRDVGDGQGASGFTVVAALQADELVLRRPDPGCAKLWALIFSAISVALAPSLA